MTSSETPTDDAEEGERAVAVEPTTAPASLPKARAVGKKPVPSWIFPLAVIPPGWFFIFKTVNWHFTPSAVLLMICWVAIVTIGYFGIRMALSAASADDRAWFAVRGQREELEREKRSLLKAIKEIEFDRETGKLSAEDAASLTAVYRARAIEVIKAIEAATGAATSVREQLLAEVRARQAVDNKVKHAKNKKKAKQPVKAGGAVAVKPTATSDEGEAS
jgi:hypothetical protein